MRKKKRLIIILISIISLLIVATITGIIVYALHEKSIENHKNIDAEKFNQSFMEYEGNNVSLEKIDNMINHIIQNNTENKEHQIAVKIINPWTNKEVTDSASLVSEIINLKLHECNCTVSFQYDSEGYINLITIDQNIAEDNLKVLKFNQQFNQYEGENISATLVKSLLTEILQSNKENEEHQIVVKIIGTELEKATVNTDNLTRIQEKIQEPTRYKSEFEYGDDGYITSVTINQLETAENPETNDNINETTKEQLEKYQNQTITGAELKSELVEIIKAYNKENPEHKVNIYSVGLKSITEIEDAVNYKITISYENDYPSRIDAVKE